MYPILKLDKSDYPRIMDVWRSSVLATHHFLDREDFALYESIIPDQFLPQVDLYGIEDPETFRLMGFAGVSGMHLEMLFVDASYRGKGFGTKLLDFTVKELAVTHVDVNEGNKQALLFYKRYGFRVESRSPKDGMGKDYPMLYLKYEQRRGIIDSLLE